MRGTCPTPVVALHAAASPPRPQISTRSSFSPTLSGDVDEPNWAPAFQLAPLRATVSPTVTDEEEPTRVGGAGLGSVVKLMAGSSPSARVTPTRCGSVTSTALARCRRQRVRPLHRSHGVAPLACPAVTNRPRRPRRAPGAPRRRRNAGWPTACAAPASSCFAGARAWARSGGRPSVGGPAGRRRSMPNANGSSWPTAAGVTSLQWRPSSASASTKVATTSAGMDGRPRPGGTGRRTLRFSCSCRAHSNRRSKRARARWRRRAVSARCCCSTPYHSLATEPRIT